MRDKLTDTAIRNTKPRPKEFKLSDGGGLHLLIRPNGSKLWRFRYRYDGKESMIGLGSYELGSPDHVPLAMARERCFDARRLLNAGQNPSKVRKTPALASGAADHLPGHTFESAARQWVESRKKSLTPKYARAINGRLERLVFPKIGQRDIASITAPDLLKLIKEIEKEAVYLARRVKTICGQIFRYGVAHGWCERDPSRDINDGLAMRPRVKHRASLKASELPDFFSRLNHYYDGYEITKLAMHFIILTAVRTDELRFAPWSEIENLEGEAPLWRIPPERMKMTRPHLVPLAPQAVAILKRARTLYPESKLIFPSQESRTGFMSENCLLYAIYHLGFKGKATVHGFRSTFSTVLNENGFSSDWIELQLAHSENNDVRAAYNAAQWLPQRREMLEWWAAYLDKHASYAETT
ncbi:MAG: integrase arm-type DNA-binding domain-containing protein, partial [Rhodomicrobium sp.]